MNGASKRIMKDIKIMKAQENNGNNIFYYPNDRHLFEGYGLVIGTNDSPYSDGYYLVKFSFTDRYPFEPPKCKYITFTSIRQNPNLYENGKVCLSILGTWGDSTWKPVFNLESILLSIQSNVLVKNALDNEPEYDWSLTEPEMTEEYDEVIRYTNYKYNVNEILNDLPLSMPF